jgi:glycosyltransferase involved in cell wall biosynthesis
LSGVQSEFHRQVVVVTHVKNQGKGAAISSALAKVSGDVIIIQDADLEYDPSEYPLLLEPVVAGRADVVYGSRFTGQQAKRVIYFWHYLGNRFLTTLSNLTTNLNLTDMETGFKVFRADVLKGIPLRSKRFGFEPEVTAKVSRRGARVYEVGIGYNGRTYVEGKKITWIDGVRAIGSIIRYWIGD